MDGTPFWAQLEAPPRRTPTAPVCRVVLSDITERKQAEAVLRESEERHRTLLQTAMDGFWLVDPDGRLLEVNETYCRMSGYSAQELLAMRIPDLEIAETADGRSRPHPENHGRGRGSFRVPAPPQGWEHF